MSDSARNPLIDPEPNDVVMDASSEEVHVHFLRHGQVYFGKWRGEESLGVARIPIDRWREECAKPGVYVLQRAEATR